MKTWYRHMLNYSFQTIAVKVGTYMGDYVLHEAINKSFIHAMTD